MTKRLRICSRQQLPEGEMLELELPGLPPLAAFDVAGEVYVTSNICTHNNALLTDGFLEDDIIECPLHGGCFNVRTGEAVAFPCEAPLATYAVVREGEDLLIEVDELAADH